MKVLNWYVFTGGPSSGKSTLIERVKAKLEKLGKKVYVIEEAARKIIDEESAKGKPIEEIRRDEREFQERVLELKLKNEDKAPKDPGMLVFLDRGIPDSYAYFKAYGFEREADEILELYKKRNYRYKKVFFLEQPPSFVKDYARIEDENFAELISKLILEGYTKAGYKINQDLLIVPSFESEDKIHERAEFILKSFLNS